MTEEAQSREQEGFVPRDTGGHGKGMKHTRPTQYDLCSSLPPLK
jgi:hypothetical protein